MLHREAKLNSELETHLEHKSIVRETKLYFNFKIRHNVLTIDNVCVEGIKWVKKVCHLK